MSCTLMDERFKEEQGKGTAGLLQNRLWASVGGGLVMGITGGHIDIRYVALIFTVASSLIIALVLFLNSYLLYKYDTEEAE